MFGTWVITSETAAPWIGLAANALGTWDFLVNAINDYRHVKQAEKIIKDSDTDSFVVTRLEIIPHDSSIYSWPLAHALGADCGRPLRPRPPCEPDRTACSQSTGSTRSGMTS